MWEEGGVGGDWLVSASSASRLPQRQAVVEEWGVVRLTTGADAKIGRRGAEFRRGSVSLFGLHSAPENRRCPFGMVSLPPDSFCYVFV